MKLFIYILISSFFASCIPLQIAPNIVGGRVVKGKKFKKNLPKRYVYVFEDPKETNEFYKYINAKYQINYDDINGNNPISIEGRVYYLTFYEVERNTQTVNLVPIVVDAVLEDKGHSPILKSAEHSRVGKWYIALTVRDVDLKDALDPEYSKTKEVLAYVKQLKDEYLSTKEYIEVYLKAG
jgi:hypothetical protein